MNTMSNIVNASQKTTIISSPNDSRLETSAHKSPSVLAENFRYKSQSRCSADRSKGTRRAMLCSGNSWSRFHGRQWLQLNYRMGGLLAGTGCSPSRLLRGAMNMLFGHGLLAIQREDVKRHSRRSGGWPLHRICCLCVVVTIACLLAAPHNAHCQQPWPSVGELAAADQDWQTVSDLHLSNQELGEVQRITAKWTERHCGKKRNGKQNRQNAAILSAKRIQLQVSGPKQLIVGEAGDWEGNSESCSCGANLNCRTWVLKFNNGRATSVLEYSGFGIVLLKSNSRGYFDLVTASNRQTGIIDLRIWRFDGERYQPFQCASAHYAPDAINGETATNEIDKSAKLSEHPCQ